MRWFCPHVLIAVDSVVTERLTAGGNVIEINEDQMIGYLWRSNQIVFSNGEDWFDTECMTDQLYAQMMDWA